MAELRAYASRLGRERKGVRAVILWGSLATGKYTGYSDADLLIICDNPPGDVLDRYCAFVDLDLPITVEPRVYTSSEIEEKKESGDVFVKGALSHGLLLWSRKE